MHVSLVLLSIFATWKQGNWKNWSQYHATILYLISMNLLYFFLCRNQLLWRIVPDMGISYVVTELLYLFVIFPATVILYLSNYPTTTFGKVLRMLKWVGIYIGFEALGNAFGKIEYFRGWNLFYSFLFLCIMFPMLRLHYVKPLLSYLISIIIIIILLFSLNIPLS